MLTDPIGPWKQVDEVLPQAIANGVSVTTPNGIICVGGGNADEHFADVFRLEWYARRLPSHPCRPSDKTCECSGAVVENVLYIAGGSESPTATTASAKFLALDLTKSDAKWKELPTWPGVERILPVAARRKKVSSS